MLLWGRLLVEVQRLLLSARLENLGMMRQLIEHHANLNATDKAGDTALAAASFRGHTNVVSALVAA